MTDVVNDVRGGLAAVTDLVFREFLVHRRLQDGLQLDLGFRNVEVFFVYWAFIGDESALKSSWGFKGSSGNRICYSCKNVVRKAAQLANNAYLIDADCAVFAQFDLESDEDIFYNADCLAAAAGMARNKDHVNRLSVAFGLNHTPEGPLLDQDLRDHIKPASGHRWDPMHCWFSNGAVGAEIQDFMNAAQSKLNLRWEDLESSCSCDWRFPGEACLQKTRTMTSNMFAEKKISEAGLPRLSATEALLSVQLVRWFLEAVVMKHKDVHRVQAEAASLKGMCEAALAVQRAKKGLCTHAELAAKTSQWMALRGRAHPDSQKAKPHYCMHLPTQLRKDGMLLDCFPHERLHGAVKQYAENPRIPGHLARSVLLHVMWNKIEGLKEFDTAMHQRENCLEGKHQPSAELSQALGMETKVAKSAVLRHARVTAGDVVSLRTGAFAKVVAPCLALGIDDVVVLALMLPKR